MANPTVSDEQSNVLEQAVDPIVIAREVRQLLGEGQLQEARKLIVDALRIHPTHAELLKLQQVVAPGRVIHQPGRYPNRTAELDWIARHRSQYQGKWVALVGQEVVALEDDAKALLNKLQQQHLTETPLVHHLT